MPVNRRVKLGVVIPVYGNEKSLRELHQRIRNAISDRNVELVIEFVNDRSPDNSQKIIEELANEDSDVHWITLSKNHGSFVAIVAGLSRVKDCDVVAILAADLQDPPETIPEMLDKWGEGNEAVLGVRRSRDDGAVSTFFSSIFHKLYKHWVIPEMPAGGFDFCLIDKKIVDVVLQSSEKSVSLVGLIMWAGFKRALVPYDRAGRVHGESMWTYSKKIRYAIDSVISFSSAPLKLFTALGVVFSITSLIAILVIVSLWLAGNIHVQGWTSLVVLLMFLASFEFLAFGILGEYFWNNLEQTRKRPLFIVDREDCKISKRPAPCNGTVPFFDLQSVGDTVKNSLSETASNILSSPQVILGSVVSHCEREVAAMMNTKYAVGVGNGTDAITIALWASGLASGDKVIVPAFTAPPTAVAVIRAGMIPVYIDIDPATVRLDVDKLEQALQTTDIKGIVPVHLFGGACDMGRLMELCKKNNLILIEDCAQSFGSTYDGMPLGTFGNAGALSFYPTKNLGAYGDGGAIITDDEVIARKARQMRFYGQDQSGTVTSVGMNSRLDELQAGLLLERMTVIKEHNGRRKEIAKKYDEALSDLSPVPLDDGAVPHLYVVRPHSRDEFIKFTSENGVATAIHYPVALPDHPYLAKHGEGAPCPAARSAANRVVSLPLHPGLADDQVTHVIKTCQRWIAL